MPSCGANGSENATKMDAFISHVCRRRGENPGILGMEEPQREVPNSRATRGCAVNTLAIENCAFTPIHCGGRLTRLRLPAKDRDELKPLRAQRSKRRTQDRRKRADKKSSLLLFLSATLRSRRFNLLVAAAPRWVFRVSRGHRPQNAILTACFRFPPVRSGKFFSRGFQMCAFPSRRLSSAPDKIVVTDSQASSAIHSKHGLVWLPAHPHSMFDIHFFSNIEFKRRGITGNVTPFKEAMVRVQRFVRPDLIWHRSLHVARISPDLARILADLARISPSFGTHLSPIWRAV